MPEHRGGRERGEGEREIPLRNSPPPKRGETLYHVHARGKNAVTVKEGETSDDDGDLAQKKKRNERKREGGGGKREGT